MVSFFEFSGIILRSNIAVLVYFRMPLFRNNFVSIYHEKTVKFKMADPRWRILVRHFSPPNGKPHGDYGHISWSYNTQEAQQIFSHFSSRHHRGLLSQ